MRKSEVKESTETGFLLQKRGKVSIWAISYYSNISSSTFSGVIMCQTAIEAVRDIWPLKS